MTARTYKAYLLRMWQDQPPTNDGRGQAPWRGTLENPTTRERHGFASLTELIAFLEQETGESVRPNSVNREP